MPTYMYNISVIFTTDELNHAYLVIYKSRFSEKFYRIKPKDSFCLLHFNLHCYTSFRISVFWVEYLTTVIHITFTTTRSNCILSFTIWLEFFKRVHTCIYSIQADKRCRDMQLSEFFNQRPTRDSTIKPAFKKQTILSV